MLVLAMDYDGNAVLKKEEAVKKLLLHIIENTGQYTIKAYTRTAISYKVKKTEATTHSFYVITHEGETYQTLSEDDNEYSGFSVMLISVFRVC